MVSIVCIVSICPFWPSCSGRVPPVTPASSSRISTSIGINSAAITVNTRATTDATTAARSLSCLALFWKAAVNIAFTCTIIIGIITRDGDCDSCCSVARGSFLRVTLPLRSTTRQEQTTTGYCGGHNWRSERAVVVGFAHAQP